MAPPKETFFRWVLAAKPPAPSEKTILGGRQAPQPPLGQTPERLRKFFALHRLALFNEIQIQ